MARQEFTKGQIVYVCTQQASRYAPYARWERAQVLEPQAMKPVAGHLYCHGKSHAGPCATAPDPTSVRIEFVDDGERKRYVAGNRVVVNKRNLIADETTGLAHVATAKAAQVARDNSREASIRRADGRHLEHAINIINLVNQGGAEVVRAVEAYVKNFTPNHKSDALADEGKQVRNV